MSLKQEAAAGFNIKVKTKRKLVLTMICCFRAITLCFLHLQYRQSILLLHILLEYLAVGQQFAGSKVFAFFGNNTLTVQRLPNELTSGVLITLISVASQVFLERGVRQSRRVHRFTHFPITEPHLGT